MKNIYEILKKTAKEEGATLFGTCKLEIEKYILKEIKKETVKDLKYAISIGVKLSDKIIEDINDHPTKLYLHHYRQLNYLLDKIALKLAIIIEENGYQAIPIPASQIIDGKSHLPHIPIAYLCGLGWIGKNNLLITPSFGCRVRLVTVITDLPLPSQKPMEERCGVCDACARACPAGAIKEGEGVDLEACYRKLDEFRRKYNIGHHICGICLKVCKPKLD